MSQLTSTLAWTTVSLTLCSLVACGSSDSSDSSGAVGGGGSGNAGYPAADGQGANSGTISAPKENDWVDTAVEDTSTFGADVDTGSYTTMRQNITAGQLPDPSGVRVEEYTNYFKYDYPNPDAAPFSVSFELAPSKFGEANQDLFRIGVHGKQVPLSERKPANLVFLVDVSGSMGAYNKLPLVQWSLRQLVSKLEPTDRLGIVVYAGYEAVVLKSTAVENKSEILDAINSMQSSGSTNGEAGIQKAYELAESGFRSDGINRVVLCTDGDFNVGLTGSALISKIDEYRLRGVTLSVLGFGMGANDATMEQLADHGNGNYALIDTQNEAARVLGENLVSTLQVIAKDVKIQVEFNQDIVSRYRLVGYENRKLDNQDFTDDTKDAGDLGAGHFVTSFYELERDLNLTEGRMATVRLRYKEPTADTSQELTFDFDLAAAANSFDEASSDFRFAAGVVEFAEILRGSKHSQGQRFDDILQIVNATQGDDNLRNEFYGLVVHASQLSH
ncbi:MAG: von Willebrand factor type A domain-containing protein [Polyangiaceae bacterium]